MARLQALLLLALFAVSKGAHGAARMSIHTYTHSHHDVIEPHEAASVIAVRRDTTFEQFITELAEVMESHHLKKRALDWLFDEEAVLARPHPHCNGLWMEFGEDTATLMPCHLQDRPAGICVSWVWFVRTLGARF
jgi:hypothetical protein